MIKKLCCLILMFSAISAYSPLANAVDFSVGATAWYTKWEVENDDIDIDIDIDPSFLYGPVLSAQFTEDFGFTFVFLYGKFNHDYSNESYKDDTDYTRYDCDAALNYTINSYFKIFAGVKYMKYKPKVTAEVYSAGTTYSADGDHAGFGPAGGISGVFPLGYDFYILANFSVMYLWGKSEQEGFETVDYTEYGINTSAALAYYITAAAVTVSLGGRYQAFTSKDDDFKDKMKFYGATLTATYSFNI